MRLLVVEDEIHLGYLLEQNLGRDGFAVDLATTLEDANAYLDTTHYSLMLLDIHLPDGNGLDLLKSRRHSQKLPPVILLTSLGETQDRILGLNAGADDYLCKPFVHEELTARIGAVLRRPGDTLGVSLTCGNIEFDTVGRTVVVNGKDVRLPRRELLILEILLRSAERLVSKATMLEAIYDYGEEPVSNAVEANVSRLRTRLDELDAQVVIQSARGLGYILLPAGSEAKA